MVLKTDTRTQTLADGANTTDADHSFDAVGTKLRNVTITLNAGQGPCLAGAFLFQQGGNQNGTGLGPRAWIRSPSLGGQTGDIYSWGGEVGLTKDAVIRIYVRNDSGATVTWVGQWETE